MHKEKFCWRGRFHENLHEPTEQKILRVALTVD